MSNAFRDGLAELIARLLASADPNSPHLRKAHAIAILYDIAAGAEPPEGFEPPQDAARSIINEYLRQATRAMDIANYAGAYEVLARARRIAAVLADPALQLFITNFFEQCKSKLVERGVSLNGTISPYPSSPPRTKGEGTPGDSSGGEL
jgi:hypothetical protein